MPFAPPDPDNKDARKIAFSIAELGKGRSNALGSFTLNSNASTTSVVASNCGAASLVRWQPQTAHAAATMTTLFISSTNVRDGSFTLNHGVNSNTDQTFLFVALG